MKASDYKHKKCGSQLYTVTSGAPIEEPMSPEEHDSYVQHGRGYDPNCGIVLELDSEEVEKI